MLMHLLFYHYFLKLLHEGEVGGRNWDFPLLKFSSPHMCVCDKYVLFYMCVCVHVSM